MEKLTPSVFLISLYLFFSIATILPTSGRPRTYIIHMDKSAMPAAFSTHHDCVTFQRELTNVADGSSVYRSVVNAPSGLKAVVQPATITFAGKYSKARFQLTVDVDVGVASIPQSDYFGNYGFLSWYEVNGKHEVRSPIVSAFAP
ncbi:hypothetical protein CCACVL1_16972 [Corchorus capsularis]|uniref:Subtilisin-like protease fibronectin type-III domain-containing protein n=1 Tax=Corchorus capsularis TaxID=210143 RepID=A0A1R3HUU2_COCAP|nr:hypothetical protein CCACVL1_16972 [Corchorus capsularis]